MAKVEVFSGPNCPYCDKVKAFFTNKGVEFEEFDVKTDPTAMAEMRNRVPTARTIPQVFIDGNHIGGCDDTMALNEKGELDSLLNL